MYRILFVLAVALVSLVSSLESPRAFVATGVSIANLYDAQRGNGAYIDADFEYDYDASKQRIIYRFGVGQTLSDLTDFEARGVYTDCGSECLALLFGDRQLKFFITDDDVIASTAGGLDYYNVAQDNVMTSVLVFESGTTNLQRATVYDAGSSMILDIDFSSASSFEAPGSPDFDVPSECGELQCIAEIDVVLVLDSSSSIDDTEWDEVQNFATTFIDTFMADGSNARLGVVSFSSGAFIVSGLDDDRNSLTSAVDNCEDSPCRIQTQTNIGLGVLTAQTDVLEAYGDRGVPRVIVTMTDGAANLPNDPDNGIFPISYLSDAVVYAQSQGTETFAVGVGVSGNTEAQEALQIISASNADRLWNVDSFNDLRDAVLDLMVSTCVVQLGQNGNPCNYDCDSGFCACGDCDCSSVNCNGGDTLQPDCACDCTDLMLSCGDGSVSDTCTCDCSSVDCNDGSTNTDCSCDCTGVSCGGGSVNTDDCSCDCAALAGTCTGSFTDDCSCDCSGITCNDGTQNADCTCDCTGVNCNGEPLDSSDCSCDCTAIDCFLGSLSDDCICDCTSLNCGAGLVDNSDCSCDCSAVACNGNPTDERCECQCPNDECNEANGGEANDDCSCDCTDVECLNGGVPDPTTCQCICPGGVTCEGNEYFDNVPVDDENCGCDCPSDSCNSANGGLIRDNCTCSCPLVTCENGGTVDPITCQCVCPVADPCLNNATYLDNLPIDDEDCGCDCPFNCLLGSTQTDLCECVCDSSNFCRNISGVTQNVDCSCDCADLNCTRGSLDDRCFCDCPDCFNGGILDSEDCSCSCPSNFTCGFGAELDPLDCSCNCTNDCGFGSYNDDCSCFCPTLDCGDLGEVDNTTCTCDCITEITCMNNGFANTGLCQCECVGGWNGDTCQTCPIPIDDRNTTYCQNGGVWNNETCSCDCPYLWQGLDCSECPDSVFDTPDGVCSGRGLPGINNTLFDPPLCSCLCSTFSGDLCEGCELAAEFCDPANGIPIIEEDRCICGCRDFWDPESENCDICTLECENNGFHRNGTCIECECPEDEWQNDPATGILNCTRRVTPTPSPSVFVTPTPTPTPDSPTPSSPSTTPSSPSSAGGVDAKKAGAGGAAGAAGVAFLAAGGTVTVMCYRRNAGSNPVSVEGDTGTDWTAVQDNIEFEMDAVTNVQTNPMAA